jgi:hypothetical protein
MLGPGNSGSCLIGDIQTGKEKRPARKVIQHFLKFNFSNNAQNLCNSGFDSYLFAVLYPLHL